MLASRRPLALLLAVLTVVSLSAACSKKKDDGDTANGAKTTTTVAGAPAAPTVALNLTAVEANGTKAPDDATVAAVKATLGGWIATAVIAPLHTGQPAGDLSPYFTAAALDRLANDPASKAALVDEGLPPATKALTADKADVTLSSVAGPDEVVAVIAAQVDLKLHAVGPTHDVDVSHFGELVLVQEADGGPWKIDSFALQSPKDSRS
jgi:hypothetical protein